MRATVTPTTAPAAPVPTLELETTNRGSQPAPHRRSLVIDYKSDLRSKWRISPDLLRSVDTVVLADSNGAMLGKAAIPNNIAVYVMRGARLNKKKCGTKDVMMQYQDYLNGLMPRIKVKLCIKNTVTEFLDTLVYKKPIGLGQSELCTRVFFKPTDTHQLPFGSSCHPRHTTKGILKSQILRFKQISSTEIDFDDAYAELYAVLKDRGYPRTLYRHTKSTVWHTDFEQEKWLRQAKELWENNGVKREVWPIVNYYDPISTRITFKTLQTISQLKCAENHRLINAFRIHDNLRRKLVKSCFLGANRQ